MSETILVRHGIVITMDAEDRIYEDGAVAIQDGRMVAVGKTDEVEREYKGDIVIEARKKAVLPGLVNLHYHTDSVTRGILDDKPLEEYLEKLWYPAIKSITPEETYASAMLSYCESIKSGTTCINDMYRNMISCAEAAEKVGIRAFLSCDVGDEDSGLDTLKDNERLIREKEGAADGRIRTLVGIEWIPITSKETVAAARELADKYGVGIHVHINENLWGIEKTKERYGRTELELAYDCRVLGPDCIAAHCVWLTDPEIALIRETGTHVAHCPSSNAKLGNGIARIPDLLRYGVNVGLGHDAAACNNRADMFEVMKWAALIHRAYRVDASLLPAKQVLRMATVNGAKALGMEREIGSLEVGKKADLITVDLNALHLTPVVLGKYFNVLSHLVYATHGEDVCDVIIDGRVVMENRVIKTVDEAEVIERASKASESLLGGILP